MAQLLRSGFALTVTTLLFAGGGVASATGIADEGSWYVDAMGLPDVHAQGFTGAGVTVAVIDDPIYLDVPTLRDADIEVIDSFCHDETGNPRPGTTNDVAIGNHGTNVTSFIVGSGEGYSGQQGVRGVAPDAKVLFYANYIDRDIRCFGPGGTEPEGSGEGDVLGRSIADAVERGADVISVSNGGVPSGVTREAVALALREGVIIVGSLSNKATGEASEGDGAPGVMNGVVSVLGAGPDSSLNLDFYGNPNVSESVDVVGAGRDLLNQGHPEQDWDTQYLAQGTSYATPIVAGSLALAIQKYPDASGNQILQSMIHNTGSAGTQEPQWSEDYGYGVVVTHSLLEDDPTNYDDINPFIDEDNLAGPYMDQIFGSSLDDPSPTESAVPTPSATAPPSDSDESNSGLLTAIALAAIVLAVVVAAIVMIAVTTSRKRKGEPHGRL